jgi:hypothetical protein
MKLKWTFLNNFLLALKQLITLPVNFQAKGDISNAFNWFPVAGAAIGCLIYLGISFVIWILGDAPAVGSVISAGLFAFFLYFINQGRSVNALLKSTTFMSDSMKHTSTSELMLHLGQNLNLIVITFLFFCKLVVSGILIYYNFHKWLLLVPLFSAGCLSMFFVNVRYEDQPERKIERYTPWLLSLLIASVVSGVQGFAVGAVIWFLSQLAYDYVKKQPASEVQNMVYGSCELVECLTLFGGLILCCL